MHIIGKSAIKIEDMIAKSRICQNIELQLFDEFDNFNDCVDELYDIISIITTTKVRVVHSPIIKGEDINLEFIENKEDLFRLEKSIELAGKLSEFYKHPVSVVIHTAFRYENYSKMPSLLNLIEDFISRSLSKYKNIIICLENVIPCKVSNEEELYFRNGCFFDNIKLVKYLREKLKTDRIGTVLDTCHMLISLDTINRIFEENEYIEFIKDFNMERFFKENKDYIKLIHLCDVKNLGYGRKEHGIKFEPERIYILSQIINLYVEYNYRCDITIEILEDDYIKNENFKDNYGLLKSLLKSNNII